MPAKKPPRGKPAWRPTDIAKATVAAASKPGDANAPPATAVDAIEVGARAIYEMRSHPRQKPWETLPTLDRAVYRGRMQKLSDELAAAGYVIRR